MKMKRSDFWHHFKNPYVGTCSQKKVKCGEEIGFQLFSPRRLQFQVELVVVSGPKISTAVRFSTFYLVLPEASAQVNNLSTTFT